nr:immunoglobulin light chain junction region [Macaca mulatta]
CQQHNSYPYNF